MNLVIVPILFVSFLVFGLTGFGSALIAMPLLIPLLGVDAATALVAIVSLVAQVLMLVRYRDSISVSTVWRLVLASLVAIPVGLTAVHYLDGRVVLLLLGCVLVGYGVYGLLRPRLPEIKNPRWAFAFGFAGGFLSGAYNTGGPPVVIYANLLRWSPSQFKSNLGGAFLLNSVVVVTAHVASGHFTSTVMQDSVLALPATLVGVFVGWWLEKLINPYTFSKLILILLIIIGLRLITSNI
ncbi:MAG: sulfite exporter TauE/SafE family protein [Anaerolineae bacterium]